MAAALQKRKRELQSELNTIEKQIYDLETNYLEETKEYGNIFTGWDAYLSLEKFKLRKNILTEERLFSLSSVTSPASKKSMLKSSKNGNVDGSTAPGYVKRTYKKRNKTGENNKDGNSIDNNAVSEECKQSNGVNAIENTTK